MKVAFISEYNLLTSVGGTEYYVDMLIKGMVKSGCEVILITKGNQSDRIDEQKLPVAEGTYTMFLLPSVKYTAAEIKQEIVSSSMQDISIILKRFEPDVIHIHTSTTFFNIRHIELCAKTFRHLFFTSHIPAHFCLRGDLIRNGKTPCNGIIGGQCNICIFSKSIAAGVSNILFQYSTKPLKNLERLEELGINLICVSAWQKEQLMRNGYKGKEISVVRQALISENYTAIPQHTKRDLFTVGFLGRLVPEKGSELLLNTIRNSRKVNGIRFVLGIPLKNSNPEEVIKLQQLIKSNDFDIVLMETVSAVNKADFFQAIDCLLIPSFFIETGPIVLLEAILYNKKVIAPAIGGPIEFAAEYPGDVLTYQWNNVASVIDRIQQLQQGADDQPEDKRTGFVEKERLFTSDHLSLYQKAVSHSSI
jgi:glycosyltransferase involved in cell wall biosynthesis